MKRVERRHRAYIHIDSVLLFITVFLLIVVEHAIIVIAVYRRPRPVTVVRKSPEESQSIPSHVGS